MPIFPNQKSKYFTQNVYLKIAEKKVPSNLFFLLFSLDILYGQENQLKMQYRVSKWVFKHDFLIITFLILSRRSVRFQGVRILPRTVSEAKRKHFLLFFLITNK